MAWPAIATLAADVQAGKLTAVELVEQALDTLAKSAEYKTMIADMADAARERAQAIDAQVAAGEKVGRLAGVPFIAKDNFLVYGPDTTAASNILRGFKAPYQATAVNKLEAEGAICIAKANLDAFAHGSSTENSDFFTTLNPHDTERVPGGSSGGSAAAVALDIAPFALGTDTGGSIREPASFCGIVGYKPTYGLISRSGVVAMASSTDVIGPLTRTVDDAALVMDVMAGPDPLDSTLIEREASYFPLADLPLAGKKIGIIKEYFEEGLDPEVKATVQAALDKLTAAGADLQPVSLPTLPAALAVYYIICPAEVSSNLARYDGQRYGFSAEAAENLQASYEQSRSQGFGKEAKRRIMIGTHVLSSGYYDAYYKKAQTVRTKLIKEFQAACQQVDFLIGPTAPVTAFKIGENTDDPLKMYLMDIMTVAANLIGNPSISIPCGTAQGLPVGLQLMADQRQDAALLAISKSCEAVLA